MALLRLMYQMIQNHLDIILDHETQSFSLYPSYKQLPQLQISYSFEFLSASLPTHALKSEILWLFVTPACLCSPHPLNHSILSLVAEDVHISSLLSTFTAP